MVSTGIAIPILAQSQVLAQSQIVSKGLGSRVDSIQIEPTTDEPDRRRGTSTGDFSTGLPDPAAPVRSRKAGAAATPLPFLRRRTDRGEPADTSIQIPPHLERRRAWRDAFGLNTFHTQQLAQTDTPESTNETRSAGALAYRHAAWRGRLDLDLAQAVSVNV